MNEELCSNMLREHDWDSIFAGPNIDDVYNKFSDAVCNIIKECTPIFDKKKRKNIAPWSTKLIGKLAVKKRRAWARYKHTRQTKDHQAYKRALQKFNEAKEEAIRAYETKIIARKNENPKRYYGYVNKKDKYLERKITIDKNGEHISDSAECAEELNNFFASVYTRGPSIIEENDVTIREYPEIDDISIDAEKVDKIIMQLDTKKSTGPDNIPAVLIKKFPGFFAEKISILLQRTLREGKVPKALKTAHVTPLFKSGNRTSPNNYRPVSITPIISKIMERIIKNHIENHIQKYDIMSASQHGFCKGKSTSSNLVTFWDDITLMADQSLSVSIIYTDLRKAFDSVPYDLLLYKLEKLGVGARVGAWLRDFLTDREQRVVIQGKLSSSIKVESGVPQGGVLSGTLFALYINDLPSIFETCRVSLYADDAKIYAPIHDEESQRAVQQDINRLTQWCTKWRLNLNPAKCFQLQYNPRSAIRSMNPVYYINDHIIERKTEGKDLGIIVSEDLKFHKQIDKSCQKATFEINRIRRSFISRSPKFLSDMYKLYVRPRMEYCVELWNPCYAGDILKLEKVQNRFTRLLNHGRHLPAEERNRKLGITSHEARRSRGDLIAMYKFQEAGLFELRGSHRTRGHERTLKVPAPRTDIRKHSLACRRVAQWNNLPSNIVTSNNLNSFKNSLDRFML